MATPSPAAPSPRYPSAGGTFGTSSTSPAATGERRPSTASSSRAAGGGGAGSRSGAAAAGQKRKLRSESVDENAASSAATAAATSPATATTKRRMLFSQGVLVDSLRASLEHERSMREIDNDRHEQRRRRLEEQIEFLTRQADDERESARRVRLRSEQLARQLEAGRDKALQELRECQMELMERESAGEGCRDPSKNGGVSYWKHKCQSLQNQMEIQKGNEENYKLQIRELQRSIADIEGKVREQQQQQRQQKQAKEQQQPPSSPGPDENNATARSPPPAPPPVFGTPLPGFAPAAAPAGSGSGGGVAPQRQQQPPQQPPVPEDQQQQELTKTRVRLAETERKVRQCERQCDSLHQRNRELVKERERMSLQQSKLERVERDYRKLAKQFESVSAANESWKSFGDSLERQLRESGVKAAAHHPQQQPHQGQQPGHGGPPPEVSTVLRFLKNLEAQRSQLANQAKRHEEECRQLRQALSDKQEEFLKHQSDTNDARLEYSRLEQRYRDAQQAIAARQAQEDVSRREIESLRELVRTFDDDSAGARGRRGGAGSASPLAIENKTLQIALQSSRERVEALKEECDRLTKALDESKEENHQQKEEIGRVTSKFQLLRQALEKERVKVQEAERRADQAQELAGKGHYNPETSRVLHAEPSPLVQALKAEVEVLKRQLDAARSGGPPSSTVKGATSSSAGAAVDPEKLNQRLKEGFKEQIALFREGVYLMTGYKFDMIPGATPEDRPKFRVRSAFAEREQDHLVLQWPRTGDAVASLDVIDTDWARALTKTEPYLYLSKFRSLPAFFASVQLSLFEKQTVML